MHFDLPLEELQTYKPARQEPSDFDDFWAASLQAARQIRFTYVGEIVRMKTTLKTYIQDAIKVEKAGLKVTLKKTSEFNIPVEFKKRLDEFPALKSAFKALTPGRQRAYIFYFSQPKQSKTRNSRIEKYIDPILIGKGLND